MANGLKTKGKHIGLGTTDSVPKPGDFPLGSLESRAAARAILQRGENERERFEIVHHIPSAGEDPDKIHVGPWQKAVEGRLMRIVYVPRELAEAYMQGGPARAKVVAEALCPECAAGRNQRDPRVRPEPFESHLGKLQ